MISGDFEGALDAFRSIPIISDIENTATSFYTFTDGILSGDLDKIKEGGFGLAAYLPYDRMIAGAGKIVKKGIEKGALVSTLYNVFLSLINRPNTLECLTQVKPAHHN